MFYNNNKCSIIVGDADGKLTKFEPFLNKDSKEYSDINLKLIQNLSDTKRRQTPKLQVDMQKLFSIRIKHVFITET